MVPATLTPRFLICTASPSIFLTFHFDGDLIIHVKASTSFFFTLCFVEEGCSIEHIVVFRCVFSLLYCIFAFSRSCYFGYFCTILLEVCILFFFVFYGVLVVWEFSSVVVWYFGILVQPYFILYLGTFSFVYLLVIWRLF